MTTNKVKNSPSAKKDYMLRVRMDEYTLQKLDEICEQEGKKRSRIVRDCIEEKHSKLFKTKK